jgi:hypothetical protein
MRESSDSKLNEVINEVNDSSNICVAVDTTLKYIAVNETACGYLRVEPGNILGKYMLELYPEITASRNHRNILKALSGLPVNNEPIESRMGDLLLTSYKPVKSGERIIAVIVCGKLQR